MAQWLRARMALPEDQSELSSTYVRQLTMPITPAPGNPLSLASVGICTYVHMTAHKHTNTHTHGLKSNKSSKEISAQYHFY